MKRRGPSRAKRHRDINSTASDAVGSCRTAQGLKVRARADVDSKRYNEGPARALDVAKGRGRFFRTSSPCAAFLSHLFALRGVSFAPLRPAWFGTSRLRRSRCYCMRGLGALSERFKRAQGLRVRARAEVDSKLCNEGPARALDVAKGRGGGYLWGPPAKRPSRARRRAASEAILFLSPCTRRRASCSRRSWSPTAVRSPCA